MVTIIYELLFGKKCVMLTLKDFQIKAKQKYNCIIRRKKIFLKMKGWSGEIAQQDSIVRHLPCM